MNPLLRALPQTDPSMAGADDKHIYEPALFTSFLTYCFENEWYKWGNHYSHHTPNRKDCLDSSQRYYGTARGGNAETPQTNIQLTYLWKTSQLNALGQLNSTVVMTYMHITHNTTREAWAEAGIFVCKQIGMEIFSLITRLVRLKQTKWSAKKQERLKIFSHALFIIVIPLLPLSSFPEYRP